MEMRASQKAVKAAWKRRMSSSSAEYPKAERSEGAYEKAGPAAATICPHDRRSLTHLCSLRSARL